MTEQHPLITGMLGTTASLGGVVVSLLPFVETAIRLASLTVGLAVGIISLVKLLKK